MAKIVGRPSVTLDIQLQLTEQEAAALDAIVGYGVEPFLDVFYEKLGKAYLQPYEAGLRSLFNSVRNGEGNLSRFLMQAKKARAIFTENR